MDVATAPEAFAADPGPGAAVLRRAPRRPGRASSPTRRTAPWRELEERARRRPLLVTQNIDDLHERAGSKRVHHLHGRLRSAWCTSLRPPPRVDRHARRPRRRARAAACRPCAPTWCGSARCPTTWTPIHEALLDCDLFVAIGTSGVVYPAAGFVHYAIGAGAHTLELNLEPAGVSDFAEVRRGPATETGAGLGGGDVR